MSSIYGNITNYNTNINGSNYDLNKVFLSGKTTYRNNATAPISLYSANTWHIIGTSDLSSNPAGLYYVNLCITPSNNNANYSFFKFALSQSQPSSGNIANTGDLSLNLIMGNGVLGDDGDNNYPTMVSGIVYNNGINSWNIYIKTGTNSYFNYKVNYIGPLTPNTIT